MSRIVIRKIGRAWRATFAQRKSGIRSVNEMFFETGRVAEFPCDDASVWQLEFIKINRALSTTDHQLLASVTERCVRAPDETHKPEVWDCEVWARAMLLALRARGEKVRGLTLIQASLGLRYLAAVPFASMMLVVSLVRGALERKERIDSAKICLAVYGENANRNQHVIGALKRYGKPLPILLIGRPRLSISNFRALLSSQGITSGPIVRPYDFRALIFATPSIARALRRGFSATLAQPGLPSNWEIAGIIYRVMLGQVSKRWQRHRGAMAPLVIYSQAGLADTSLLERAQQELGMTTVHWTHGISAGRNFVGHSNICLLQCAHDATWHDRMGGYQGCLSDVGAQPEFVPGGQGWLLLSNLVHPMNPDYGLHGSRGELELLNLVADCAKKRNVALSDVCWKPHPAFQSQPDSIRDEVLKSVQALGFSRWDEARPLSEAANYSVLISTPSTILLDLLRLGKLGILVDIQGSPGVAAIDSMPLKARNGRELSAAIETAASHTRARALFEAAWAEIGPSGQASTLERIVEFVGASKAASASAIGRRV